MIPQIVLKPGKERSLCAAIPGSSPAPSRTSRATCKVARPRWCAALTDALWRSLPTVPSRKSERASTASTFQLASTRHFSSSAWLRALARRDRLLPQSQVYRWVHGEADGLPGLIVDRYDDVVVAQFLSSGAEFHKDTIAAVLVELTDAKVLYQRSDTDTRELEGLPLVTGEMYGSLPAEPLIIEEHGLRYAIDVRAGHKTGFYLDQRDNRQQVGQMTGQRVLNCFCYSAGFSLAARQGGASEILSIDASADALALAAINWKLNDFAEQGVTWKQADVFTALRELRDEGRQFDTIVLDPPKFAPTAGHVEKAARAYKDINLLALKLLAPGGRLYTFSCSGGVPLELFQKIVAGAAADARVGVMLEARLAASVDHPVLLAFPEGEYLKGLVLSRA